MQNEQEQFYLNKSEPVKSCLLVLRDIILGFDKNITPSWKYKMPFFCFNHKTNKPYIGFVDGNLIHHPKLIQGNRNRMKILPINPTKDIPVKLIELILEKALELRKKALNKFVKSK